MLACWKYWLLKPILLSTEIFFCWPIESIRPPSYYGMAESQGGVSYTTYILDDNYLFTCGIVPGCIPVDFDGTVIGLNETE